MCVCRYNFSVNRRVSSSVGLARLMLLKSLLILLQHMRISKKKKKKIEQDWNRIGEYAGCWAH